MRYRSLIYKEVLVLAHFCGVRGIKPFRMYWTVIDVRVLQTSHHAEKKLFLFLSCWFLITLLLQFINEVQLFFIKTLCLRKVVCFSEGSSVDVKAGVMGVCSWEQSAVLQMVVFEGTRERHSTALQTTWKLSPVRIHHHFSVLLGSERSKQIYSL